MKRRIRKTANGPGVREVATDAKMPAVQRIGFMKGEIRVPDDFDTMGTDMILELMIGKSDTSSVRNPR